MSIKPCAISRLPTSEINLLPSAGLWPDCQIGWHQQRRSERLEPTTDNRQTTTKTFSHSMAGLPAAHPSAPRPAPVVITVGGTNGKGSTIAFLEAMLAADGKRVGCYTSPHLLRYNERVRVPGEDASDTALIDAFERIEAARVAVAG